MTPPRQASRPLASASEDPNQTIAAHLERALEAAEDAEAKRHIREALQQPAIERGEL